MAFTWSHVVEEGTREPHDEQRGERVPDGLMREHEGGHWRQQVAPVELHEQHERESVLDGPERIHRHQERQEYVLEFDEQRFLRRNRCRV